MAELTIRPEEIRDALEKFVAAYEPGTATREEIGVVTEAGDGIARIEGLPSTMTNELLQFEDGTLGIALNLDVREIGVVILGEFSGIEQGGIVRRTGEVLSVPVANQMIDKDMQHWDMLMRARWHFWLSSKSHVAKAMVRKIRVFMLHPRRGCACR